MHCSDAQYSTVINMFISFTQDELNYLHNETKKIIQHPKFHDTDWAIDWIITRDKIWYMTDMQVAQQSYMDYDNMIFASDTELIAYAGWALRIYLGGMCIFGAQIACQMTFISIGNAKASIMVAIVRKFVLLLPLIYLLPRWLPDPTMAVYTAEPVADFLAVTFTAILFSVQFRKVLRNMQQP